MDKVILNAQYNPFEWSQSVNIRLLGGLGNQLFQLAFGHALQTRCYNVTFDKSHLIEGTHREYSLGEFGDPLTPEIALPESDYSTFTEKSLAFDVRNLEPPNKSIMVGYWQNEKYMRCFYNDFTSFFEIYENRKPLTGRAAELLELMQCNSSVFLHVRRKDYVELQHFHGMPSTEYYVKAYDLVSRRCESWGAKTPKAFVFSDEPEWCKDKFPNDFVIVEGTNKYEDLRLMSWCRNAIIANSSFSWWGAWLGEAHHRLFSTVVAPKRWFTDETANTQAADICPERWIRL
jgi:hypothetical protein